MHPQEVGFLVGPPDKPHPQSGDGPPHDASKVDSEGNCVLLPCPSFSRDGVTDGQQLPHGNGHLDQHKSTVDLDCAVSHLLSQDTADV